MLLMLDEEMLIYKNNFADEGYVVIRNFFSDKEIKILKDAIVEAGDKLSSHNGLNKNNMIFYSNVFQKSTVLQNFITQDKIINFLSKIIGPDFWVRWDQCVAKGPGGAAFPWHQDNAYSKLKDDHFQFWIGITDMNKENGGLWIQPKSHEEGLLPHSKAGNHLSCDVQTSEPVFVDAKKGDIVLFSSLTLHHTQENKTKSDRWAYVIEYMSLDHYDPLVKGPYFIAAENGEPSNRFVKNYRGSSSLTNRLKYTGLWTKQKTTGGFNRFKKLIVNR